MSNGGKAKLGWAVGSVMLALAGACGGVSTSDVVSARNQATTASCMYYQRCNQIGPGQPGGDTVADCMTTVVGKWTMGWPTTTCEGHIDQANLTICLDAIGATTDCSGIGALLALSKCSSASVCSEGVTAPADGSAD